MDIPSTTDEFYHYLKGIKEMDDDKIPYGGASVDALVDWLRGSYGLNNTGVNFIDKNPNGDGLRFVPTSDAYKEMIGFLKKLYDEELIEQSIFTIENDNYLANFSNNKYASTVYYEPEKIVNSNEYVPGGALKGPKGDKLFSASPYIQNGAVVLTSENEHPIATMRWADYFYSDEGAKLLYMGVEDETYTTTDEGELEY